jgi:3D-(3,5/4)-trihydroxycyclohexane-1,2-dione acylhydrolase (decyclizing)
VGGEPFNNLFADARHETLPRIDFVAHAQSLGAIAEKVADIAALEAAVAKARGSERTHVIVIDTDPDRSTTAGGAWWDVAVAEVATSPATAEARAAYEAKLALRRDA